MSKESWKPGNMLYPVPAVMVSCKRPGEKANIITLAWAGTICSDPAMLSVSIRPERYSYDIIKETGEFVVNLVNTELTRACDWCGVRSGRDYDKFKELKLTEYTSEFIDTPAIEESPVNIYCKVKKIEKLGSHDMFIAEVVGVTVDDKYMDAKGSFDLKATNPIAYSHGEYFALGKKIGKFGYSVKKSGGKSVSKMASKEVSKTGKKTPDKKSSNTDNITKDRKVSKTDKTSKDRKASKLDKTSKDRKVSKTDKISNDRKSSKTDKISKDMKISKEDEIFKERKISKADKVTKARKSAKAAKTTNNRKVSKSGKKSGSKKN